MPEDEAIITLELRTEKMEGSVSKIETIFIRALGLWGRFCRLFGVPADSPIVVVVSKIQHLLMMVRLLTTAIATMQAASGPLGWVQGAIGVGSAIAVASDFMTGIGE